MRTHVVSVIVVLSSLLAATAQAQCLNAPPGPSPRVSRAQHAARQRAWSITDMMPQSRHALDRLGPPTRSDTFPVIFSEAQPDSTFVLYEVHFGTDFYGITQNRAGREWLDAVSLTVAESQWPDALKIGAATAASARDLGQPQVVTTGRDTTLRCYPVQATRGGQLYLYYVGDTLRRVTWSLALP